jgi:hypothetical protein
LRVGEGDGDGASALGLGLGAGSLLSRFEDRLDVSGSGFRGGSDSGFGSGVGVADGSGSWSFKPTLGAAPPAAGTRGRAAATGDESDWAVLVNVTTVAAATVVITVAAANLYTFVACMLELPGTRTLATTTHSTVAGTAA